MMDLHFFRPRPDKEDPVHGNPFVVGRETPPSFTEASIELFIAEMDDAGIDHAVIVGQRCADKWGNASNDDISQLIADYPGRFTGFGGIDPNALDVVGEVRRATEDLGLAGIALVPGWGNPPVVDDDPLLMPLYEWCAGRGIPVTVTSSHFIGPDMLHAHPVHLQRVALAYPELTIIVGHAGWPWTAATCSMAMRCTNVYLMPEFYMYLPHMPGSGDYVDAANGYLKHRMLYSSCYPSNSLKNAVAHFHALPLSESAHEHLLWRNGERLLKSLS